MQVYDLKTDLLHDPKQMHLAQALTLDRSKPRMGLKGKFGLFGSEKWWKSIEKGRMPTKTVSGRISRLFYAGMDSDRRPNSIMIESASGEVEESMYFNNPEARRLYVIGSFIEILYALEPLKNNEIIETVISVSIEERSAS
ncbi:hypothetical protein ACQKH5_12840 [Hyphomonas sp. NPDC076900]|uniref:hypothetical protein n=1 Tax=unclassified Hyphomonas TaxID=2630699 RepID=UPI003CFD79D5